MTHPYLTLLLGYLALSYLIVIIPYFAFTNAALFGDLRGRTTPKFWFWVLYFVLCAPYTVPKWLWSLATGRQYCMAGLLKEPLKNQS